MRGVSEVIAIILILMITISLAGLAYMFMSTTMADVTSSAGSTVDTTTSSMMTSFTIESIDVAKVYVRNTGQNTLTSLSVYVNDELAGFSTTPETIAPGQVGTITIYSFIGEGDTIKITSPSGFSTSKKAPDPCAKAVGCWKFNEGSGSIAYDSSPYSNTGTITGAAWTSGKNGGGLLFDGSDYVNVPDSLSLRPTTSITMCSLFNLTSFGGTYRTVLSKSTSSGSVGYGFLIYDATHALDFYLYTSTYAGGGPVIQTNTWYYACGVWNGSTGTVYLNGINVFSKSQSGTISNYQNPLRIGSWGSGYGFIGIIDEVRIYDRAIY